MTDETGEIETIRQEMLLYIRYVPPGDLKDEMQDWVEASARRTDADTAPEYIESQIDQMMTEYPMYYAPELDRAEDGFPAACEGCPHYGGGCPIVHDLAETDWRDRRLEQAETAAEAKKVYRQQAVSTGCHRIHEWLEEFDEEHAEFVALGYELLNRAEDRVHELDTSVSGDD